MLFRSIICAFTGLTLLQCTNVTLPDGNSPLVGPLNRPSIRHLGIEGSSVSLKRVVDFIIAGSFAVSLRTIVLGSRTAISLQEAFDPIQRLLTSAGQSLRTFSCLVNSPRLVGDAQRGMSFNIDRGNTKSSASRSSQRNISASR